MHNCLIQLWRNDSLFPGTGTVAGAVAGDGLGAGTVMEKWYELVLELELGLSAGMVPYL